MADAPKSREELEAMINARAWKNPAFKKKLLSDPHGALKEIGVDVPKHMQIRVFEVEKDTLPVVLLPPTCRSGGYEGRGIKKSSWWIWV